MIKSSDKLTVYERIKLDDSVKPYCDCGKCKFCNAKGAENIAINHLLGPIEANLGDVRVSLAVADLILSPGENDISKTIGELKEFLGEKNVKKMLESAEEFRMCETTEEAMVVKNKFPFDEVV